MTPDENAKKYGAEYPAAITTGAVRLPLLKEARFWRDFGVPQRTHRISRFMDGSASMTLAQLEQEWPGWSDGDRLGFCGACNWLHPQADFPAMLRFVMQAGGPDEWAAIALSIATYLQQDEAFGFLSQALGSVEVGDPGSANLGQALARTRHPAAEAILRRQLAELWQREMLWEPDDFINWEAFVATCTIQHLIDLGAAPADFADQVRRLADHICARNRDSCRNFLGKHYEWLGSG